MRKLVLASAALTAVSVGLVGLAIAATPGPDYLDVASWKAAAKKQRDRASVGDDEVPQSQRIQTRSLARTLWWASPGSMRRRARCSSSRSIRYSAVTRTRTRVGGTRTRPSSPEAPLRLTTCAWPGSHRRQPQDSPSTVRPSRSTCVARRYRCPRRRSTLPLASRFGGRSLPVAPGRSRQRLTAPGARVSRRRAAAAGRSPP